MITVSVLADYQEYCDPAIWQQAVAKLQDMPWAGTETKLSAVLRCCPNDFGVYSYVESEDISEGNMPKSVNSLLTQCTEAEMNAATSKKDER